VVSTSSDPRLGAIRLAWWRERLDELDWGRDAPAEPRLQSVARDLMPLGVSGSELSRLEDAWIPLLQPFPWGEDQSDGLKLRGQILFSIGARLLGANSALPEPVGAFWSLADGAAHCSDAASQKMLVQQARTVLRTFYDRLPARLRPLTVLAALAAADLVRQGSGLARVSAAFRHRLFGTLPR